MNGPIIGVLLAAGAGRRFGGAKLLATLADGRSVAQSAYAALAAGVDGVVAVVRPDDAQLQRQLQEAGATVLVCPDAAKGMGTSLAHAIAHAPAAGWLVALADMPFVAVDDVRRLAQALRDGASIAALGCAAEPAHPVGFSAQHGPALMQLQGDRGARALLQTHSADIVWLAAPMPASQRDIDTVADWQAARRDPGASAARTG